MINKKQFILILSLFLQVNSELSSRYIRQWQPFGSNDGTVVAIESSHSLSSFGGTSGSFQQQPQVQLGSFQPVTEPGEKLISGITFDCTGKPTGPNKDTRYCDIFHACVFGKQLKTYGCPQVGNRFYYDEKTQRCELSPGKSQRYSQIIPSGGCPSNNYYQPLQPIPQPMSQQVQYPPQPPQPYPSQPTLPPTVYPTNPPVYPTNPPVYPTNPPVYPTNPQTHPPNPGYGGSGGIIGGQPQNDEPWKLFVRQNEAFLCAGKADGFYPSNWCNVFYRCFQGSKFEFLCAKQTNGDRLWWNQHSTSQVLPQQTAQCGFPCIIGRQCSSPGGVLKDESQPVSSSLSDPSRILSSCPTSSPNAGTGEDTSNDLFRLPESENPCIGQQDGAFLPSKYCNVFHRCINGKRKDFLCAKGSNSYELFWNDATKLCDYPCLVQCSKPIYGSAQSASQIQALDTQRNPAICMAGNNGSGGCIGTYGCPPSIYPTQPTIKPTIPTHPPITYPPTTHPAQTQPTKPPITFPPMPYGK